MSAISCLGDPVKTTIFILAFYSSDDSGKVLDENVRIFNSLYQGYSNYKRDESDS